MSVNVDELAELNYSGRDPQYQDPDEADKADIKEALEQITDDLETVIYELEAVKQNFVTRRYNKFHDALTEIKDQLYEELTECE